MQSGFSRQASALLIALSFGLLPQASRAEDDVSGLYVVKGSSQGARHNEGVARIAAVGKTYEILWQIGQTTYKGRGLASGKNLAFAFVGAGFTKANVILYEQAGDGIWCGVWTSDNSGQLGQEALILKRDGGAAPDVDCREITASGDGVDVLERQVAGDQGDGDAQLADEFSGQGGDQRTGTLGAGGGAQHQDGDRRLFVD